MISRLMPLPIPYSSICSPTHIRKIVPAVMIMTLSLYPLVYLPVAGALRRADPTLEEVARCKKRGILINTFMLASDYGLVQFVQKVTQMCRGRAYFTTPYTLGNYLLMDYMNRKTRTIH